MTGPPVFQNIYSIITQIAEKTPDAIAIEAPRRLPITYAGLLKHVIDVSTELRRIGLKREDRVGVVLPNGPEMAITLLATCTTTVSAPLNPIYQRHEFENYLSDLNIKLLILQDGTASPARLAAESKGIPVLEMTINNQTTSGHYQLLPQQQDTFSLDSLHEASTCPPADPLYGHSVKPEDLAIVLHTSGTTALPKIVPLSHYSICLAVHYVCQALKLTSADRCLSMMPQFHIGGLVDLLLAPLASGGTVICTKGFDSDQFFTLLNQYRPTWYQAVPATLSELLVHAKKIKIDRTTSSLRFIRSVATSLTPKMMHELEKLFTVPVIETFGMTEAAPLITTNPLPPEKRKPGSTGKSVGPEITITDGRGTPLPTGVIGEILIRGGNVISGYENNPDANKQSFHQGWFHTGDLGYLDEDGYLFIKGRVKEIINRGGEKISPQEIDAVLLEHTAVAQAVTFSIPHEIMREDIAAAVVSKEGQSATEKELKQFAAQQLAIFKIPRAIFFVESIPRGPTGKPQRIGLADKLNIKLPELTKTEFMAPRTLVEKKLADIWAKILKIDRVGIYDNFFDLGGNSLRIVMLYGKIERTFNLNLPLYTIFQFSCIAKQAQLIEKEEDPTRIILKSIQKKNQTPIFWIGFNFDPGLLPLIPLETYWEKSPDKDISGVSIEDMAASFVNRVQGYLHDGPYCLGGYSIGGLIALETAKQLKNSGYEIPLLFLVDPATPGAPIETGSVKISRYLKKISLLSPREKIPYTLRRLKNFISFSNFVFKPTVCRLFFKYNKPLPFLLRSYYAHKLFYHAAAAYNPLEYKRDTGKVSIYFSKLYSEIIMKKWRLICPDAEMHIVDTDDHLEMIKPPLSNEWQRNLKEKLLKADKSI